MPNFILKNPIRFSEGSGSTITPSDTNISLDSPQTVTISIGQNVAPTQNLIFSDVSSSVIQESGSSQIQENSFENINTFTANTDISTNLDVLEDLSINGTVVAMIRHTGNASANAHYSGVASVIANLKRGDTVETHGERSMANAYGHFEIHKI